MVCVVCSLCCVLVCSFLELRSIVVVFVCVLLCCCVVVVLLLCCELACRMFVWLVGCSFDVLVLFACACCRVLLYNCLFIVWLCA